MPAPRGRAPSSPDPGSEVTELLLAWSRGDGSALERLLPLVYEELHRRAEGFMRRERAGHTLQPTALVHETYLKLIDQKRVAWKNRAHFLAVASQAMRRVLVDHARRREAKKRGGTAERLSVDAAPLAVEPRSIDLLALDEALHRLAALDDRQARLVELRFFGGLTVEETAGVLGVSPVTVNREWAHAQAWLHAEITGSAR